MIVIFPDPSLVWMLKRVVGIGVNYHLFTNNYTPTLSDTLASYTEAVWSGYASIFVPAADWILQNVNGHVGLLQAGPIHFPNTAPIAANVYGYFVTDNTGAQLICAARFDITPLTIPTGDFCPVTPLLGSYSGNAV